MKFVLFTVSTCLLANVLFAQVPKVSIAVFPFVYALPDYKSRASQVQGQVVEILTKKSNVNLIDRSTDTFLLKELDYQIREQSMATKELVQQGKVLGAKNMIVGTISNVRVEEDRTSKLNMLTSKVGQGLIVYKAYINFSLQLLDVESGKIIKQRSFDNKEPDRTVKDIFIAETAQTPEAALVIAMKVTRKYVLEWLNESYPPDIRILKIEERNRNGFPETILVTGIDASFSKGSKLSLNEIEMLDAGDGKQLKRSRPIAELKVSEIQGDITICKVTSGERAIEAKMTSGVKLEVLTN